MRYQLIPAFIIIACMAGCTSTAHDAREAVAWSPADRDLGRTLLLMHIEDVGSDDKREERTADIHHTTTETLSALEGTEVVDSSVLGGAIDDDSWRELSDYETIMASRAAGLDSICELTVRHYAGWLRIGFLPLPGWDVASLVRYRLRVLDVETGRIIVDTERFRQTRRPYAFGLPAPIQSEFERDLRAAVPVVAASDL